MSAHVQLAKQFGDLIAKEDYVAAHAPLTQPMLDGDVANIYISLEGDSFCEAVSVFVAKQGDDLRIRDLEWGRP